MVCSCVNGLLFLSTLIVWIGMLVVLIKGDEVNKKKAKKAKHENHCSLTTAVVFVLHCLHPVSNTLLPLGNL